MREIILSGRLFAQTLLAEDRARDALADAQQASPDAVRLATESLDSAGVRFDAAILDFAETIKEAVRAEYTNVLAPALIHPSHH